MLDTADVNLSCSASNPARGGREPGVVAEPPVDGGATGDAVGTPGTATEPTDGTTGDVAVDGGEVSDGSTRQPDGR